MFCVPVAWWGFIYYLWAFFVILFAVFTGNINAGKEIGASGTPVLFINGRKIKYRNNPEIVRAIIKEEQVK